MDSANRIPTGIKELDRILDGGFPAKTAILLSGDAGSGKTLFGLNWLVDGAARGERCCYLSVSETEEELLRACDGLGSLRDAQKYVGKNLIFKHVTLGKQVDVGGFAGLFDDYPDVDRLVIDNVNKLLMFAANPREYRIRLAQLVRAIKEKARCALLLCEASGDSADTGNGEAFECDGVVQLSFLEFEEKPMRALQVRKLRYTSFEPMVPRELVISNNGITLAKTKFV